MREIKFRVFDTQQNKFLKINDYINETWQFNGVAGFGNMGVLAYQIRENGLNSKLICDDERFKIKQFTGLKDRKGTEIYEGDIIKAKIGVMDDFVLKVEFENGKFITRGGMLDLSVFDLFELASKCEVIGNICENKRSGATKSQVSCEGEATAEQNSELLKK